MYHFAGETLRNGQKLPVAGDVLVYEDPLVLCESGYHMSERISGALQYAPGPMLALVEPGGDVIRDDDKLVARERLYLTGYVDVSVALLQFTRECALRALRIHAPAALKAAGLIDHAVALECLKDDCDLAVAEAAAKDAEDDAAASAMSVDPVNAASYAAWTTRAAGGAAWSAARAAGASVSNAASASNVAWAAGGAARNAAVAAVAADVAAEYAGEEPEKEWQEERLRALVAPLVAHGTMYTDKFHLVPIKSAEEIDALPE